MSRHYIRCDRGR